MNQQLGHHHFGRIVHAAFGSVRSPVETASISASAVTTNTHHCCAERRLLRDAKRLAMRHGVPERDVACWCRRKFGSDITVWRVLKDGTFGCSYPCVLCRRSIEAFGLRVHAVAYRVGDNDGPDMSWYHGHVNAPEAPPSRPTRRQRHTVFAR